MKKLCASLILAAAVVGGGCSSARQPSQKEVAVKQWNAARAGVLASLAQDQYTSGNFDKSRSTVQDALKMDPENISLRILSAKLYIEQGQLEMAEADLKLARALAPDHAEAEYLSGVIFQRWQQPQRAYDHYSAASEKAPAELPYLLARAEMLVAMDRSAEALTMLQSKVIYFEHSAAIRDAVGQLLLQEGRYTDAADMLRQASILAADDSSIREHLALSLYYAKQYREAVDVLSRLIKDAKYASRADLLIALGECQMQIEQARDARLSFEAASQIDPASPEVWLSLGKAALQANDVKRAELSLKKAMSLAPQNTDAHLMLGYLRLRQDRLEEALASFHRANSLDRSDTVSLCMIGYVLERMGRAEQSMQYYAQALNLKPNDDLASKLMANVNVNE